MDDLSLQEDELRHALSALRRVNLLSQVAKSYWAYLLPLAQTSATPLRVLDLATGSGDIPISLWHRAQRAGLSLALEAIDCNSRSIAIARERGSNTTVSFREGDALSFDGQYDVILCSLFLHHLEASQIVDLLRIIKAHASKLGLISDLRRSRFGWLAAGLGTQLLTASQVARYDALRSVEGALTPTELETLARAAGMTGVTISRRWPFRMLMRYEVQTGLASQRVC